MIECINDYYTLDNISSRFKLNNTNNGNLENDDILFIILLLFIMDIDSNINMELLNNYMEIFL